MDVFAYVMTSDTGFAPNPFHGLCTLACCKPKIRKLAQPGDWVVGLASESLDWVYAMEVTEVMTFKQYWNKPEARAKHSHPRDPVSWAGDNVYEPLDSGGYRAHPSQHSCRKKKETCPPDDFKVDRVLLSDNFVYWGAKVPKAGSTPASLRALRDRFNIDQLKVHRPHRRITEKDDLGFIQKWKNYIAKPNRDRGICGWPRTLPINPF